MHPDRIVGRKLIQDLSGREKTSTTQHRLSRLVAMREAASQPGFEDVKLKKLIPNSKGIVHVDGRISPFDVSTRHSEVYRVDIPSDRFSDDYWKLVNDIQAGFEAEIAARRKDQSLILSEGASRYEAALRKEIEVSSEGREIIRRILGDK